MVYKQQFIDLLFQLGNYRITRRIGFRCLAATEISLLYTMWALEPTQPFIQVPEAPFPGQRDEEREYSSDSVSKVKK